MTSVLVDDTPEDSLDLVAVSGEGAWRTRTRGSTSCRPARGDLTTAVFLANLLDGRPLDEALARTTSSVFAVIEETAVAGEKELQIVAAQDRLAEPRLEFTAEQLR